VPKADTDETAAAPVAKGKLKGRSQS
jgi:hypothetical protein